MTRILKTAPTVEPLTLAEAKEQIRVTWTEEDSLINLLIAVARMRIEEYTNRALITQTWYSYLDAFPDNNAAIEVVPTPLISVTSIGYTDEDGAAQTLTENTDFTVDKHSTPGRIVPIYEGSWPVARVIPNAVTLEFVSGYGATAASVPDPIRQAMLLLIGHLFEHRESINIGNIVNVIPQTVEWLCAPYRDWRFK